MGLLMSMTMSMHGAQVLSPKHAKTFSAMEYFNTYGGCTAAGAAGMAVLKILQEERLQEHAHRVGEYLLSKLAPIKQVCTLDMQKKRIPGLSRHNREKSVGKQ